MTVSKEQRTRALRYKRPALASMGYEYIQKELEDIVEACGDVAWFAGDRDALTTALDGSDEETNEFILACGDLSGQAGLLLEQLYEVGEYDPEGTARMYDDCTVALIGNRYDTVGFDTLQEDYFSLTAYDTELACTDAGKRLMRRTKAGFSPQKTLRYMAEQGLIGTATEKKADGREVSRNTVLRRLAGKKTRVVQFHIGMLAEPVDRLEEREDKSGERDQPQPGNSQTTMEHWMEIEEDGDLPFE